MVLVIASLADVVRAMRKGHIPSEMGTGRIIKLMKQGEKFLFSETRQEWHGLQPTRSAGDRASGGCKWTADAESRI